MPTIKDVLREKGAEVISISPGHTIKDAIAELVDRRIGSLLVTDTEGEVVGIITERDILRVVHSQSAGLSRAKVSEYMTTEVCCGVPEDDLDYVMNVMTETRFRRMPVVVVQAFDNFEHGEPPHRAGRLCPHTRVQGKEPP